MGTKLTRWPVTREGTPHRATWKKTSPIRSLWTHPKCALVSRMTFPNWRVTGWRTAGNPGGTRTGWRAAITVLHGGCGRGEGQGEPLECRLDMIANLKDGDVAGLQWLNTGLLIGPVSGPVQFHDGGQVRESDSGVEVGFRENGIFVHVCGRIHHHPQRDGGSGGVLRPVGTLFPEHSHQAAGGFVKTHEPAHNLNANGPGQIVSGEGWPPVKESPILPVS